MSDAAAIRADVIGRWILIIAAVVLPWLAFSVARRTIVRWPSVGRAVAVGGARVIAVIAGVFGVVFAMCAYPAPGAGPKARLGYREAAPIIQALDAYRNAQGGWPASIEELTPTFLADTVRDSRQNRVISGWHYRPSAEFGYELTFFYAGPASNSCTYTPIDRKWSCVGAF